MRIDRQTLVALGNLSRRHPQLLDYFEQFRVSLQQFTGRHLMQMVIGELVKEASFEVHFAGATLRFDLTAAIEDNHPVGVVTAYEPRPNNQEDYKVGSFIFNRDGLSNLGETGPHDKDFVYNAEDIVGEFYRQLFTTRAVNAQS